MTEDKVIPEDVVVKLIKRWRHRLGLRSYAIYPYYVEAPIDEKDDQLVVGRCEHVNGNVFSIKIARMCDFHEMRDVIIDELMHIHFSHIRQSLKILYKQGSISPDISNLFNSLNYEDEEFAVSNLTMAFLTVEEYNDEDLRPKEDNDNN